VLGRVFRGKFVAALRAFADGQLGFHGNPAFLARPKAFSEQTNPRLHMDQYVSKRRLRATPALFATEYRVLVEQAPIMIWRSNTATECDYFNDRWLLFRGHTWQREVGKQWAEGVHPDDLDGCLETYLGSFERRETFEMYYRLKRSDRVYRWIFDRGVLAAAGEGAILAGHRGPRRQG
jgi:PAS domain-containing protein